MADYPREAEGLKFFLTTVLVALLGVMVWVFVAQPMGGSAGSGAVLTAAPHGE